MAEKTIKRIWTVPNILTLSRIGIVPFFMFFMYLDEIGREGPWNELACFLFVLASVTDNIDGYIARKYDQISTLGQLLDPLADKLLVTAAFVMLIPLDRGIPAWAIVLMLGREIAVTGLRGMATEQGVVISALPLGKLKAFMQMLCIPLLIYGDELLGLPIMLLGRVSFWIALVLALISAIEYAIRFIRKVV